MPELNCFTCGGLLDTSESYKMDNLKTSKHKNSFVDLICESVLKSDTEIEIFINKDRDTLCKTCYTLLDEYDALINDAKIIGDVLNIQILKNYEILPIKDEDAVLVDSKKSFVEICGDNNNKRKRFRCIHCNFETPHKSNVSAHVLFHQINSSKANQANSPSTSRQTRSHESPKSEQLIKIEKYVMEVEDSEVQEPETVEMNYEEAHFLQLIDLEKLTDKDYATNLRTQKCALCPTQFTSAARLVKHLKLIHHSTVPVMYNLLKHTLKKPNKTGETTCPYCFLFLPTLKNLHDHVVDFHENASLVSIEERQESFLDHLISSVVCETCGEIEDNESMECKHQKAILTRQPKINCSDCAKMFYSKKLYNTHRAVEHSACFVCKQVFKKESFAGLKLHFKTHISPRTYQCKSCFKHIPLESTYKRHIRETHPSLACTSCDKIADDQEEMTQHIRFNHANKKVLDDNFVICDHCGKSQMSKLAYDKHYDEVHKGCQKVYLCKNCDRKFPNKYLLIQHLKNAHKRDITTLKEVFYACHLCTTKFDIKFRKDFINHLAKHKASVKVCDDCQTHFNYNSQFEVHRENAHQDFTFAVIRKATPEKKSYLINENSSPKQQVELQSTKNAIKTLPSNQMVRPTTSSSPTVQTRNLLEVKRNLNNLPNKAQPQPLPQQLRALNKMPAKPLQMKSSQKPQLTMAEQQQEQELMSMGLGMDEMSDAAAANALLNMDPSHEDNMLDHNEQNTVLVSKNIDNIIMTEDGQIIIRDINDLMFEGNHPIELNLQEFLLNQGNITILPQEDAEGDFEVAANQDISMSATESSNDQILQNFNDIIFQTNQVPSELIQDQQGTDYSNMNVSSYVIQDGQYQEATSDSNGVVIGEVVVDHSEQIANQTTLDELGDILLEVAKSAEQQPTYSFETSPAGGQKRKGETGENNKRKINRNSGDMIANFSKVKDKFDSADKSFSNFSQAYELFVKGFDEKKKACK